MRSVVLGLVLLAAGQGPFRPPDEAALEKLSEGTPSEQRAVLDRVLAHTDATPSVYLFLASAAALQLERVEDSGFLLYAAQLRSRLDLERYPPTASGGDGPGVLIGALSAQVGQAVNPAIMRDPKVFRAVLERLRAWNPQTAKGYDPGWGFNRSPAPATVDAETAKREYLAPAEGMARLLETPEYFEAFRTVQDFNLDSSGDSQEPPRVAAARQAQQTMAAIEKRLGIPGLYSRSRTPAPRAASAPPAPPTQPPRRVGGAIAEPKRVRFVQPTVPADLPSDVPRTVILELTVDERGRVVDANVLRGHPAVDRAVAEALSQWVYEPALEYGQPVPVIFTVTVNLR